MTRRWILLPSLFLAWASFAHAANIDKSDLNGDGIVDHRDVELLATDQLDTTWEAVDACNFYASSILNPRYFRRVTKDNVEYYGELMDYIAASEGCYTIEAAKADKSDLNDDGVVDLDDVIIFSSNYLELNWQTVDWCLFYGATMAGADFNGESTSYYRKHFPVLLDFINEYFNCSGEPPPPNPLALENNPNSLVRIADATAITGSFYFSDPRVGSVFIFNSFMVLDGELKGLNKPLGVAVDEQGRIFVGNDGRNNIEVYDSSNGDLLAVFGQGLVSMPNAITFDNAGNAYVTDSRRHAVFVFDPSFNLVRTIGVPGDGEDSLRFPMDAEIIGQEIFVADQKHFRVQVYDLAGNWQRSITFEGTPGQNCNWFTGVCEIPGMAPFTRLQGLSSDSQGRLHVLDNFAAAAHIFDVADGTYIESYGGYGTTAGLLSVPMDVSVTAADMAVVTAGDGDRIELFTLGQ